MHWPEGARRTVLGMRARTGFTQPGSLADHQLSFVPLFSLGACPAILNCHHMNCERVIVTRLFTFLLLVSLVGCSSPPRTRSYAELVDFARCNGTKRVEPTRHERLNFSGLDYIHDSDLIALAEITHLRVLDLRHNPVTDAGLHHLAKFPSLVTVDLSYTMITDAGLERLATMTNLTEIGITNNQLSREAVEKLRRRLPNAYI